jgi:hypothetical protein
MALFMQEYPKQRKCTLSRVNHEIVTLFCFDYDYEGIKFNIDKTK